MRTNNTDSLFCSFILYEHCNRKLLPVSLFYFLPLFLHSILLFRFRIMLHVASPHIDAVHFLLWKLPNRLFIVYFNYSKNNKFNRNMNTDVMWGMNSPKWCGLAFELSPDENRLSPIHFISHYLLVCEANDFLFSFLLLRLTRDETQFHFIRI